VPGARAAVVAPWQGRPLRRAGTAHAFPLIPFSLREKVIWKWGDVFLHTNRICNWNIHNNPSCATDRCIIMSPTLYPPNKTISRFRGKSKNWSRFKKGKAHTVWFRTRKPGFACKRPLLPPRHLVPRGTPCLGTEYPPVHDA